MLHQCAAGGALRERVGMNAASCFSGRPASPAIALFSSSVKSNRGARGPPDITNIRSNNYGCEISSDIASDAEIPPGLHALAQSACA